MSLDVGKINIVFFLLIWVFKNDLISYRTFLVQIRIKVSNVYIESKSLS